MMPAIDFSPMPLQMAVAILVVLLGLALLSTAASWRRFNRIGATSQERERSIGTWVASAVASVVLAFLALCGAGCIGRS